MTLQEYMLKAEEIRKIEFMSRTDLARELGLAFNTFTRLEQNPDSCSLKTMRKIKAFVDNWQSKKAGH